MPKLEPSSLEEMFEEIDSRLHDALEQMVMVTAADVGLDLRAGRRLWIDSQHIVVRSSDDRILQYYGGFQYVDPEYRSEFRGYVIYRRKEPYEADLDEDRVGGALDFYSERQEEEAGSHDGS
jgi:hypothetical protein